MQDNISYRPDVDGLRALAVLAVVLYHAGLYWLSGGFVGVDIFFVISGYLITSLIFKELQAGTFSFSNFWLRRVRRILPASMFMMGVVAVAYAFIYPPDLYSDFGRSLVAQGLFSANILFWLESGYFDRAAELKPLLHTWSLAVEEQFYFLFPPLLWCLFRYFRKRLFLFIAITTLCSLAVSIWGAHNYPIGAFYLLPSRAWELGIGAILALSPQRIYSKSPTVNNVVSIIGIILVLYSIFAFDRHTPFPSWYALVPTLGTAALIYGNRDPGAILARFFSMKPVVAVGLISYSLYLWHWPILVANRWVHIEDPTVTSLVISVVLAFILAIISYFWVEQPLRLNKTRFTTPRLLMINGSVLAMLLLAGLYLVSSNGAPRRSDATLLLANQDLFSLPPHSHKCDDRFEQNTEDFVCKSENYDHLLNRPFFLWGDSHASAMMPAFQNAANELGVRFEYATHTACPPILGVSRLDRPEDNCREFNDAVFQYLVDNKIERVFLVWRQNIYTDGREGKEGESVAPVLISSHKRENTDDKQGTYEIYASHFAKTILRLRQNNIDFLVFRQVPNFKISPLVLYPKYLMLGREMVGGHFGRPRLEFEQRSLKTLELFAESELEYIDLTDQFCDKKTCYMQMAGTILYRDDDHLGKWGVLRVTPSVTQVLKEFY